jgi:integrase
MRERGTGRLFLRGDIWWCQYYLRGQQIRVSTGEMDEKRAGKFLKRKLAEVETNTHADSRNLRYEDLRDAYMQDYAINGRKSLRRDKGGELRLDPVKRLDDFFLGWRAVEIDADQIRKFQADQQAKELSNASINRAVSSLRRMFHLAVEEGKLRTVPYFPMLREAPARKGFFERDSFAKLSRELPDYLRLPLALGFFTGMRLGEIKRLEWEQIDFIGNAIMLRAGETKNDEARSIPIVPQLRALLVEQHGRRKPGCPYVCFRLDRRGLAVKLERFRKAWQSACVRAGLGKWEPTAELVTRSDRPHGKVKVKRVYRGMIFHDLRRSAVRNLVRSQVPEIVARQITGHKTRSVFDRYNIVSAQDLADASRKLADYLENGDKTGTMLHQNAASSSGTALIYLVLRGVAQW